MLGTSGGVDAFHVDRDVPWLSLRWRVGCRGLKTPALDLVFDESAERAVKRAVRIEIRYRAL